MPSETIVVADDHPVFRDGLCALIQVVAPDARLLPADTFQGALALARDLQSPPSMLVLDLCFARQNIKLELPALRREFDRSAIVIVTMAEDRATIDAVMACGVNGYIGKAVAPADMVAALRAVRQGEQVINAPAAEAIAAGEGPLLSDRQLAVLQHIATGRTNKEIARALDISPFTVRIHVSALFRALGVNTRSAAVTRAVAEGLLRP
ncbi:Oxygen regulatory protein NreC [Xylophilus ampelinus]|nr:response regulator transcription factor [Variovorax sp.]VTY37730.1 Oxygen regulatory protein NreC [Xylophilus ampelinus]